MSFLFPPAQAAESSGFLWDLVNWVIPLESFGVIFEQLGYLVTDPEKFEADEFVIALVEALTIFPPAKGLKVFTTPLKAMTRALKRVNPKFAKHLGGFLNRVMQKAKQGDFDTLWNLLPFLVVAAEMYSDEEARKGLEFLMRTVDSADDIVAWVDYLGLPAEGWSEDGPPPAVDAFSTVTTASLPMSFLFEPAYAAPKVGRVAANVIGKVLTTLSRRLSKTEIKNLPDALAIVKKELDVTDFKDFRKYVFKADLMKSAVWTMTTAGSRALRSFMRGKSNARYSPAVIASTMAYLGWESACGIALDEQPNNPNEPPNPDDAPVTPDDLGCDGKGLNAQVREEFGKKVMKVFADAATGKLDEEPSNETKLTPVAAAGHGALFHLVQLAYYQLQHRFAGGAPVKGIEKSRWVALFDDKQNLPQQNSELICGKANACYIKKLRYVDIVLGENGEESPEHWIELKSWGAQATDTGSGRYKLIEEYKRGDFARWDYSKSQRGKNITLHRQFSLDRAAAKLGVAWLPKKERGPRVQTQQDVGDFEWRFQAFKTLDKKTNKLEVSPLLGSASKKDSVRWLVAEAPEGAGLPKSDEVDIQTTSFGSDTGVASKAKLVTATTVMADLVNNGFDLAKEAIEATVDSD